MTRIECVTVVERLNAFGTRKTMPKLRVGVQAFAVLTCQSAPVTLQLHVMPLL